MKRRKLYVLLTLAAVSLIVASVTLGIVLSKPKDDDDSSSSLLAGLDADDNTTAPTFSPFITPNASLVALSSSPTDSATEAPSSLPTALAETNFNETMTPTENATDWLDWMNETLFPPPSIVLAPSISPIPPASNDVGDGGVTTQPSTTIPVASSTASPVTMAAPSKKPTRLPTLASVKPTTVPVTPAGVPISPTIAPVTATTADPTPLGVDGRLATISPTEQQQGGDNEPAGTRFYAIGDAPYSNSEAAQLKVQIADLQPDAEFVIHVGDIRSAKDGSNCTIEEYHDVAAILNKSDAPVFIILGDNEWNDCPNIDQGFDYWMTVFGKFDEQWSHSFAVKRHDTRPENFAFVHKRTLFFGLNLVGGLLHRAQEWEDRLGDLFDWVKELVDARVISTADADSVVIFGHANPTGNHADFFVPLTNYLSGDAVKNVPFLYLNGDAHAWNYKPNFYGKSNLLRIQVVGGTKEPPLQMSLQGNKARTKSASQVFQYDRMLSGIEI